MKNKKLIEISSYLDQIKEYAYIDIAHVQNNVLNKNPYSSNFIGNYFSNVKLQKITLFFLSKKIIVFYLKNFFKLLIAIINFLILKIFGRQPNVDFNKELYVVDIFFIVDKIIKEGYYRDSYLPGLYEILDKYNKEFIFLPRLFGVNTNPIKFLKLIKVLNEDKKNTYLFQYDLLSFYDFIKIANFIINYPKKQFNIIQKQDNYLNGLFNYELFNCLPGTSFEPYLRYLIGIKLANKLSNSSKVICWQEFQNLEKTFYKAIRETNENIVIYGCEFLIKYQNYLSMHITDTDKDLFVTPHKTLLNGKYNYSLSKKHNFQYGVSLRYKNIFRLKRSFHSEENLLALLGQDVNESRNLLKTIAGLDELLIKLHPSSKKEAFDQYIKSKWRYTELDLYDLFKETNIVFVSAMTGTALEAVACGISVIIFANPKGLNINPLTEFGYGKIWDIIYEESDLLDKIDALLKYRNEHKNEILAISKWYRSNFFIEPTEANILKAFEL